MQRQPQKLLLHSADKLHKTDDSKDQPLQVAEVWAKRGDLGEDGQFLLQMANS